MVDVDLEDMVYSVLEIVYDNKRMGLDYEEDFQLLLELDDESKDLYKII